MAQPAFGEALPRLWPRGRGDSRPARGTVPGKFLAARVAALRRKLRAARPAVHAIR
jgi:hypothetical protein